MFEFVSPSNGSPLIARGDTFVDSQGNVYPVIDGIPRFVDAEGYTEHFGAQWKRFRKTQLDSHVGWTFGRDRLKTAVGPEMWNDLPGKQVLEIGCGAGRFTEVLLERGATVVSTDMSTAVEANAENFPHSDRHAIAQADLMHMPVTPASFDLVLCLGVVQHTPDSRKTIEQLNRYTKPGGWLVFDHYLRSFSRGSFTRFGMHLARARAKTLGPEEAFEYCDKLVQRYFPLHRRIGNRALLQKLASRFSPILVFFHYFPELSDEIQYELSLLDTHDSLTDHFKTLLTKKEVEEIIDGLNGQNQACEYGHNGVVARVKKPADAQNPTHLAPPAA